MKSPLKLFKTARQVARRIVAIDERTEMLECEVANLDKRFGEQLETEDKRFGELFRFEDRHFDALNLQLNDQQKAADEMRSLISLATCNSVFRRPVIRVVFLVHNAFAWQSLAAVYTEMASSADFEPIVVTIPHHWGGRRPLQGEAETHYALEGSVPHLRSREDENPLELLHILAPDVIFRQSQWDADIDGLLGTEHLGFARTCLVPYELVSLIETAGVLNSRDMAVDSYYHHHAWLVFCLNASVDAASSRGRRSGAQFRAVGHPKLDYLRSAKPLWAVSDTEPGRARVFRSSHHSLSNDWNNFGAFHLTREEMLDWAAEGEAEFVWSPHPSLIPFVESGQALLSPQELEEWRVRWDLLPNTSTLLEPTYARQLAACDVVVTDGLSMLIEGQVLEKPVVFIERSDHLPFNEAGNLTVQGVHRVNSVLEAKSVVEDLLCYGDPLAGRQQEIVRDLLGDPGASGRVLQEIAAEAVKEGWRAAS